MSYPEILDEYHELMKKRVSRIFRNEVLAEFASWSAKNKGVDFKPIIEEYENTRDREDEAQNDDR